ncbi:MAG: hypothetical protein AB4352_03540 [Hormoscilla sp.]
MSYSDFDLGKITKTFNLATSEKQDLFADTPEVECSDYLAETLRYNLPLALASNSEKARSEMIVAPILIELRKHFGDRINLFSGVEFDVDAAKGLNGRVDFLISQSLEQLFIAAPVITLVEAKKENLNSGLGQCVAEMIAARTFNEREQNEISAIYGAVTSGTNWKFLRLQGQAIQIDLTEYYLVNVQKILGILALGIRASQN